MGPVPVRQPGRGRRAAHRDAGAVTELVPVDDLVFHSRDDYALAANWKIACENYLECYHCPVAHKGFSAAYDVDPDEYRLEPIADHVLSQFAHTRNGEEGQGQFHFVWPNLKINVLRRLAEPLDRPGAAGRARPLDRLSRLLLRLRGGNGWIDELLEFDRQVGAEDRVLVERVQKGVRSGIVEEGRLLDESEQLVARFQELVSAALS